MKEAKGGIKVLPEELQPAEETAVAAAPAAVQGAIPEGTVIGDGKIKINLARIDSRLLHGQVATAWTQTQEQTASSLFLTLFLKMNFVRSSLNKRLQLV